uniref:mRNA_decap_C domain-containing protein n=1 Tax=Mesocestoides corti TaxID=53468 RepID=A0A5K3FC04_MESCO
MWFYEREDCVRIGNLIKELKSSIDSRKDPLLSRLQSLSVSSPARTPSGENPPSHQEDQPEKNASIIQILSMASAEFESQRSSHNKRTEKNAETLSGAPSGGSVNLALLKNLKNASNFSNGSAESSKMHQFFVSDLEQGILSSDSLTAPPKPAKCDLGSEFLQFLTRRDLPSGSQPSLPVWRQSAPEGGGQEGLLAVSKKSEEHDTDAGYLEDTEGEDEDEPAPRTLLETLATPPHPLPPPSYTRTSSGHRREQHPPVVEGLTRGQLKAALLHLLEHDDNFLTSIHNAYVASLNRRLVLEDGDVRDN